MRAAESRSDRSFRTSESAIDDQVILDHPDQDEATGLNRNELNANDTASIPVTGERLVVGKTAVESGRVRVSCIWKGNREARRGVPTT